MEVESERLEKALRKLQKAIKRLDQDPLPEEVHKLRTEARRVETIASALTPGDETTALLIKSIKPLRKAAGSVRDIDVLTAKVLNLPKSNQPKTGNDTQNQDSDFQNSLTRFVEYLGVARQKEAKKLFRIVERKRESVCRDIKRYRQQLESPSAIEEPELSPVALESQARAFTVGLVAELGRTATLTARNIHIFRLKVRALRSILELVPSSDPDMLLALTQAKDEIGEWHDWHQLASMARQVLKEAPDRALLTEIDRIAGWKLSQAVKAGEALRRAYLQPTGKKQKVRKKAA
jgi:CHAD domain-containing protein